MAMITKLSELSVRMFMACLYEDDQKCLEGGDWDRLFTEYVDLSGAYETREYDVMVQIHNLQVRIAFIASILNWHLTFFNQFGEPFVQGFKDLRKYGHRLNWDPDDREGFIKQMSMVETKEIRFQSELDKAMKELKALRTKGLTPVEEGKRRHSFIRLLNGLRKVGFKIDKDKTDMEELCLMINDHNSDMKEKLNKQISKSFR